MLTLQEIFDKSVGGVIAQGCAAMDSTGCTYAGPEGTACAIGQLLPRDVAEKWQRKHIGSIAVTELQDVVKQDLTEAGIDYSFAYYLLVALQNAHDSECDRLNFLAYFRDAACRVAEEFDLDAGVAR